MTGSRGLSLFLLMTLISSRLHWRRKQGRNLLERISFLQVLSYSMLRVWNYPDRVKPRQVLGWCTRASLKPRKRPSTKRYFFISWSIYWCVDQVMGKLSGCSAASSSLRSWCLADLPTRHLCYLALAHEIILDLSKVQSG